MTFLMFRYKGYHNVVTLSRQWGKWDRLVCHESCTGDEGRPLGADLQEEASNHLKRLWTKAKVVSVKGKGLC